MARELFLRAFQRLRPRRTMYMRCQIRTVSNSCRGERSSAKERPISLAFPRQRVARHSQRTSSASPASVAFSSVPFRHDHEDTEWAVLKPEIYATIMELISLYIYIYHFFATNQPIINENDVARTSKTTNRLDFYVCVWCLFVCFLIIL